MITSALLVRVGLLAGILLSTSIFAAETPAPSRAGATPAAKASAVKAPATNPARPRTGGAAKGPLPDPALLDGAAQQADKQSENGMLGEFELPGDENVRNGQVGGPQNASPQAAQDASVPQNGGSPQGTAQAASAGGAAGGPEVPPGANGAAAGGGSADQKAGSIPGGGDPNAAAQGIQVAELQGEPQGGGGGPGDMPQKPPPVAIGDSAMQIQGVQNAPSVVGGQVAGQTQQMEKAVGGSGKGASGNTGNRGAEKGRVMPSGL
jgi:hypothetical protein